MRFESDFSLDGVPHAPPAAFLGLFGRGALSPLSEFRVFSSCFGQAQLAEIHCKFEPYYANYDHREGNLVLL